MIAWVDSMAKNANKQWRVHDFELVKPRSNEKTRREHGSNELTLFD